MTGACATCAGRGWYFAMGEEYTCACPTGRAYAEGPQTPDAYDGLLTLLGWAPGQRPEGQPAPPVRKVAERVGLGHNIVQRLKTNGDLAVSSVRKIAEALGLHPSTVFLALWPEESRWLRPNGSDDR